MYAVIRILEARGRLATGVPDAARARAEALGRGAGFVTLLAVNGDDGALVTVEIYETLDDLKAAQADAGPGDRLSPSGGGPERGRTIAGEIVFQRGL